MYPVSCCLHAAGIGSSPPATMRGIEVKHIYIYRYIYIQIKQSAPLNIGDDLLSILLKKQICSAGAQKHLNDKRL